MATLSCDASDGRDASHAVDYYRYYYLVFLPVVFAAAGNINRRGSICEAAVLPPTFITSNG